MNNAQELSIARFDFGALRDFSHPFEARTVHTPILVDLEVEPEAPPPPPTFSQEQLDQAVADAVAQGRLQGIEEGRQRAQHEELERQQATQAAITSLASQMQQAAIDYSQKLETRRQESVQLSVAVARQVCATALKHYPASLFDSLVARCLPIILRQPRLIVTMHPDMLDILENSLRQLRMETNYEGTIEMRGNTSLGAYDAKLQWEDGSAEIRMQDVWSTIEGILHESLVAPSSPASSATPATHAPAMEAATPELPTPPTSNL